MERVHNILNVKRMPVPDSIHKKKLQKKIRSGRKVRLLFEAEKQKAEKKEDRRPDSTGLEKAVTPAKKQ